MLSWMSGGRRSETEETSVRSSSLCGYLWKMKRSHQKRMLIPQWNKRWFSIEGRLLRWYTVAQSEESSGMVDLRFITNVSAFEVQGVFSFILSYPDRNLLLRASNLSDMNKWIRALQFQTDIVRGGCGMTIVTDSNTSGSSPQGKGRAVKEKYRPPTLEANLEAAMVRLQILENRVLKQSYDTAKTQPARASKEIGRDVRDRDTERDKGREDSGSDLRPEDVRLVERERERSDSQKREANKNNVYSGSRDFDNNNRSDNNHNDVYRNDFKNDEDCDNNELDDGIASRGSRHHNSGSSNRTRNLDEQSCPYPEREGRDAKDRDRDRDSKPSSQAPSGADNDEESIEEIIPKVRNNTRVRSQVNRLREEKDRERDRERDRGAGSSSNKGNQNQNQNQGTGSEWTYEGEMYTSMREENFEGGVSRRQSLALHAAARISSAGSHRGSEQSSARIPHMDDGPDFDDLPEMDMTVRKPSQRERGARDRKLERENSNSRAADLRLSPSKSGNTNGGGWV